MASKDTIPVQDGVQMDDKWIIPLFTDGPFSIAWNKHHTCTDYFQDGGIQTKELWEKYYHWYKRGREGK